MTTYIQENRNPIIIVVVILCVLCICCIASSIIAYASGLFNPPPPGPGPLPPPPTPGPTQTLPPPPPPPGPGPTGLFYLGPKTIPGNTGFTKNEATNVCQRLFPSTRQATLNDLQQAHSKGYDLCEFAWLSDSQYPAVSQQRGNVPTCSGLSAGINYNAVGPDSRTGVYCVGPLTQQVQSFARDTWVPL